MPRPPLPALLLALGTAGLCSTPAGAAALQGTYEVRAAGLIVMEVEATVDLDDPQNYSLETRSRVRGVASVFSSTRMTTRTTGRWNGDRVQPARYLAQGTWRGGERSTVVDYEGDMPVLRQMVPPLSEEEREPVPPEAQRGTIDSLSAVAQLLREVRRTGRCEAQAAVYDGRRRTEMRAQTVRWEVLQPSGSAWSGRALHCRFEGRQTAGFRRGDDATDRRPQEGSAWLAEVQPGTSPVPVRLEVPSPWFGNLVITLVRVGPAPAGR
ncbi:DUF3108 domain-containing protein [Roseomonas sp. BN140053]|uniref:DUF3108 domain-containing protein n=1 Tax=Roseomonas sp. BN140053 TaxID=3391898 RepID=UPI0039EA0ED5